MIIILKWFAPSHIHLILFSFSYRRRILNTGNTKRQRSSESSGGYLNYTASSKNFHLFILPSVSIFPIPPVCSPQMWLRRCGDGRSSAAPPTEANKLWQEHVGLRPILERSAKVGSQTNKQQVNWQRTCGCQRKALSEKYPGCVPCFMKRCRSNETLVFSYIC